MYKITNIELLYEGVNFNSINWNYELASLYGVKKVIVPKCLMLDIDDFLIHIPKGHLIKNPLILKYYNDFLEDNYTIDFVERKLRCLRKHTINCNGIYVPYYLLCDDKKEAKENKLLYI